MKESMLPVAVPEVVQNNIVDPQGLNELQRKILSAVQESKDLTVTTDASLDKAGFFIKGFKEISKKLESIRKEIVDPMNNEVKSINAFFKLLKGKYEGEEKRLLDDSNFHLKKKREAEEAERKREQEEMEQSALEEAELFEDETVLDEVPEVEIKREKVSDRSENLATTRKKMWKVTDFDKIPRKYLTINEALVNELRNRYDFEVKKQPIEGIEFFFEEKIRVK